MIDCEMQSLIEARHDNRLGGVEADSVARHVKSCRTCRAYAQKLAALRSFARLDVSPPGDAFSQRRSRLALLKQASEPRQPAELRVAPLRLVGAMRPRRSVAVKNGWLLLAAAVTLVLVIARTTHETRTATLNAAWTQFGETDASGVVAIVNSSRFTRMTRSNSELAGVTTETVRLVDGEVDVQVAALSGAQRFVVRVGDGTVEVRGTHFSVAAKNDRLTQVLVEEGRVEVRTGRGVVILNPGDHWLAEASKRAAVSVESAPPKARLGVRPERTLVSSSVAARKAAGRKKSRVSVSDEFSGAVAKLETGDHVEAAQALSEFSRLYPSDPRAEDADYLVILTLQRAGQRDAARQAARRYLVRYPKGARREWARLVATRPGMSD